MRFLDLPHGYVTTIDDNDWFLVKDLTLYRGNNGYVYYSIWQNKKSQPRTLHSLLVKAPKGKQIDHIDGDKLNNCRGNLRIVSPQRNQVNRRQRNRNNSSGVRGVRCSNQSIRNPWLAQITASGRGIYLGLFATQEEAILARRTAEMKYYGEYCP